MKHERVFSRAFNSLVAVIVASILSIAIFFVYKTYEKSVETDIFRYSHKLEDSIRRTAAAEYRRYFLLVDFAKTAGTKNSGNSFEKILEEKSTILGKDGEIPNLVSSIGYYDASSPESALEYNFEYKKWSVLNNIFNNDEPARKSDFFYIRSDSAPENLYLAVNNGDTGRVIFFRVDTQGFLDNYVSEVVESSNEEFRVDWLRGSDPESRRILEDYFEYELLQYHFRPLQILLKTDSQNQPLIVEIPIMFDIRRVFDNGSVEQKDVNDIKQRKTIFFDFSYFVRMMDEDGSYYSEIEHDAAVSFFQTIIIFITIGILFILLLFQLQRIRLLRSKEKEFVASVTHELRTPLTVIRSAADNLLNNIVSREKLPVYGGLIIEQSERLGNMIEEILLYSNFENKNSKSGKPVKFDFKEIVSRFKPALDALGNSEGLKIHWDINGLPEKVGSFPDVITLTVNNLVSNAVNHAYSAPGGEIRIIIRYLVPERLSIAVEDDGRGVDPRELKHIFEPFYRDNVSRSRQERGSGLGLFIARRKAALSGGKLTVESPYRRIDGSKPSGCRFVLTLPCLDVDGSANKKQK